MAFLGGNVALVLMSLAYVTSLKFPSLTLHKATVCQRLLLLTPLMPYYIQFG